MVSRVPHHVTTKQNTVHILTKMCLRINSSKTKQKLVKRTETVVSVRHDAHENSNIRKSFNSGINRQYLKT